MLRHGEPIALQFIPASPTDASGLSLLYAGGGTPVDLGYFNVPFKCEVFEANILVTTGLNGDSNWSDVEISFDRRFTPASDTGRTDGDVGNIFLGVSGASAAGDVVYDIVAQDTSTAGVTLEPGMQVVVELNVGQKQGHAATGRIWPTLLVRHIPEVRSNLSAMQATS